jgi:bacterioferritin
MVTSLAKESIEEMEHADKLVVRIIFLEGFPNLQLLDPLRIGQNVKEVLDCDLAAEISARTLYQEAATYCHTAQDYVTRDLFEKLMADEERHIDFLETQLDLVSRLGLETLRAASYRQDERERRLITLRFCGQDARLHGYGFTAQISFVGRPLSIWHFRATKTLRPSVKSVHGAASS